MRSLSFVNLFLIKKLTVFFGEHTMLKKFPFYVVTRSTTANIYCSAKTLFPAYPL